MGDEFSKFGEWEDAWQEAFNGPEHTPPDKVWRSLENSLMEQQLLRYRRKLVIYQWLAAASVLLLGFWAGWWLFFGQTAGPDKPVAGTQWQQTPSAVEVDPQNTFFYGWDDAEPGQSSEIAYPKGAQSAIAARPKASDNSISSKAQVSEETSEAEALLNAGSGAGFQYNGISPLSNDYAFMQTAALHAARLEVLTARLSELLLPEAAEDSLPSLYPLYPGLEAMEAMLVLEEGKLNKELRMVAVRSFRKKKKNVLPNGSTWVGASVASSYFDPNLGGSGASSLSWTNEPAPVKGGQVYSANAADWNEKESSLPSVNFSLDAAFRIGKRWILQSSLAYGTFKVGTLSGTFTDKNSSLVYPLYYTNFNYERLQVVSQNSRKAAPVDALNTYKFLSVPLVFKYVLLERSIGLSLGSGISTDVFMGGQIMDRDRRLQAYTLEPGKDSPFHRLHFNGLVSAQLFYRAGPHHLFTVEPTYKHSLTNFSKNNGFFQSRPSQLGVSVGFRYILQ